MRPRLFAEENMMMADLPVSSSIPCDAVSPTILGRLSDLRGLGGKTEEEKHEN
jgi:hypothetical protein